jgi:hypothetical protein
MITHPRFKFTKGQMEYKKAVIQVCRTLPCNIIEKIYSLAYPTWKCCTCVNNVCFLCKYACCENAEAVFCVCLLCTKCPKHGTRCHGTHD